MSGSTDGGRVGEPKHQAPYRCLLIGFNRAQSSEYASCTYALLTDIALKLAMVKPVLAW
ncbi:hypothetical protein ASPCADRAFT_209677 [Aspergillus carbonarius ITEM 5010]|uniref:Uncharacterized protein n=1 Tax=Aspergillus carbonarius (strain ITEM 5010) TaxID=602072 RepID=A0A1R3REY0_ASPC5|nr:hypothetical protein ASPCADRAFT_209677 [Aspergillus carbonarius ITEM 5010]